MAPIAKPTTRTQPPIDYHSNIPTKIAYLLFFDGLPELP
jgi:hypothetical protein